MIQSMFMLNDMYIHWEHWEIAEDLLDMMGAMNAGWHA